MHVSGLQVNVFDYHLVINTKGFKLNRVDTLRSLVALHSSEL